MGHPYNQIKKILVQLLSTNTFTNLSSSIFSHLSIIYYLTYKAKIHILNVI